MITRSEYMKMNSEQFEIDKGQSAHHKYYSQFVTPKVLELVKSRFTVNYLKAKYAADKNLNNISLGTWDSLAGWTVTRARGSENYTAANNILKEAIGPEKLKETGEGWSCGTGVCILKTAAKILIKSNGA